MYYIGPHVSAAGGIANGPLNAAKLGATGFAFFLKNQRQWTAKPYSREEIVAFRRNLAEHGFLPESVLPHAGYLINLANPDPEAHQRSMDSFLDELMRCAALGLPLLNLHPGSHLRKLTPEAACDRVAQSINAAHRQVPGVTVVLENTAGQGGCLGHDFAELARIRQGVEDKSRLGFCIDTAHTFEAGRDLSSAEGYFRIMEAFDTAVGLDNLRGMHLNDSKTPLAARVDRHESLGKGHIGWELFRTLCGDRRLEGIPLILETPDESIWADEVARLKDFTQQRG